MKATLARRNYSESERGIWIMTQWSTVLDAETAVIALFSRCNSKLFPDNEARQ
jgi:hypothetical protein